MTEENKSTEPTLGEETIPVSALHDEPNATFTLETQIAELNKQLNEAKDAHLRAKAETENMRRRSD
jgi:molecular chaperone GrpE